MKRLRPVALAVVALAIVIGGLIVFSVGQSAPQRTKKLLQRWHDLGGATAVADLQSESVPDEQNAAVLYWQARNALTQLSEVERDLHKDRALNDQSRALLSELDEITALLVRAGQRPECVWKEGLQSYEQMATSMQMGRLPDITSLARDMRMLANILLLAATDAAAQGDEERALQLFVATRQLAINTMRRSTAIAFLAGAAIDARAWDAFEHAYRDRPLPDDTPDALIFMPDVDKLFRDVLIVEGTQAIEGINLAFEHGMPEHEYHERMRVVGAICHLVEQLDKPADERDPFVWDAEIDPPSIAFTPKTPETIDLIELNLLTAKTAIEIRRHREQHGGYPENWDMPIDPMSVQPLLYQRTAAGFEIRTVDRHPAAPPLWEWH